MSDLNPAPTHPRVDIVIPVYNEEEALAAFHRQLSQAIAGLPYQFTIFYINDGSTDHTQQRLEEIAAADARLVVVELSRNFGHQSALTAGLDLAQGDYVITLDGDGQHPPELIPEMLQLAQAGYDMVLTQRMEQGEPSGFKRWTSHFFYRLINRIGDTNIQPGGADFRLLNRSVVQSLRGMREYHRFLRGMVAWMGFRQVILPFTPAPRLGGSSKYSLRKMFRLGADAVFSFSLVPLYLSISLGLLFLVRPWPRPSTCSVLDQRPHRAAGARLESLMFMLLVWAEPDDSAGFIGIYIATSSRKSKGAPLTYPPRHPASEARPRRCQSAQRSA